jgi:hypothetical protein
MVKERKTTRYIKFLLAAGIVLALTSAITVFAQAYDPSPPEQPVKLIFIHHSTGENWLRDDWGGLGQALMDNNYFVSDTNYGWGPDAIGDRTDIVDWPDWFRGPDSIRYMNAVFQENQQHSEYSRMGSDPGGENTIVMFKSCFPNSDLYGSPDDPPIPGREMTVGNAKYIYNDLLAYFKTRPDKLFVVITAPPLSDSSNAANARAFNTWLVQDWLAENDYPYDNVAVFDFYNVLTDPDNHHRYQNGAIEYINDRGGDTSYYPSGGGDDHPNAKGSRKATDEFVTLLNVYYNRWKATAPAPLLAAPAEEGEVQQPEVSAPPAMTAAGVIDDFESPIANSADGWQGYWDEAVATRMNCALTSERAHSGASSLGIDFDILPDSWATCVVSFDSPQDWSDGQGVSFYYQAAQAQNVFEFIIYTAPAQEDQSYEFSVETVPESVDGWVKMDLPWEYLLRASWQEDAGTPLASPTHVYGFGFGFSTYPDAPNTGMIWVDDITLAEGTAVQQAPAAPAEAGEAEAPADQEEAETPSGRPRLCGGSTALVLVFGVGALWLRKRTKYEL